MPRFDKTGPDGNGPMTGRGLGKCNPNHNIRTPFNGNQDRGLGRGLPPSGGRGLGRGRRLGNRFNSGV